MELENAIVLVPENDNNYIKLIELNDLKIKSTDDYFTDSVQIATVNKEQSRPLKTILYKNVDLSKTMMSQEPTKPNLTEIGCLVSLKV